MMASLGLHSTHQGAVHCQQQRSSLVPCFNQPCHQVRTPATPSSNLCLRSARPQLRIAAGVREPAVAFRPPTTSGNKPRKAPHEQEYKYRAFTKQGNLMTAVVIPAGNGANVQITLEGPELDEGSPVPMAHWGMYRASNIQWYHPKETVPPNSTLDSGSGGMRTPMVWSPQQRAWTTSFTVPAKLLPLHLALVFYHPGVGIYEAPFRSKFFSVPVGMSAGKPETLGATIVSSTPPRARPEDTVCTVNFAVYSRHASAMYLCLVRIQQATGNPLQGTGVLEIALDPVTNKTGDVWHICIHGLRSIGLMCYGWRADGDVTWENGGRFHAGFMLHDPHASRVVPVLLPETAYTNAPKLPPTYDVKVPVMLSSLAGFTQSFSWEGRQVPVTKNGAPLQRSLEDQVLLEVDVARFTTGPDAEKLVPPERQGRFLGLLDRMKDIVGTGATGVILTPVALTAPGNGRHPVSLFAPDVNAAVNGPLAAANELKTVIKAFHSEGLEVLLSVEYSLTAEGSDALTGGLQGMRGIDAATYYRVLPDGTAVLAAGHPIVRKLVLESLRHWRQEFCVDGFCFTAAENLTQDRFGSVLDNPPLAEEIAHDPVLGDCRLVAVPGNTALLPREGMRGFPHWSHWLQVNDRFRADMWSYLVDNTTGRLSAVATRLAGSADLFGPDWEAPVPFPGGLAAGRRAAFGLNTLIGMGDGQLLQALEADQDLERAEVLARTLLLALFVSSGTPVVSASTLSRKGLWRFVSLMSTLRKQYGDLLNPPLTFVPPKPGAPPLNRELRWHGAGPGTDVDWQGAAAGLPPSNVIAFSVRDAGSRVLYVAFNPYLEPVSVALPGAGPSGIWRLVVDTSRLPPDDINLEGPLLPLGQPLYELAPKAGVLMVGAGNSDGQGPGMSMRGAAGRAPGAMRGPMRPASSFQ